MKKADLEKALAVKAAELVQELKPFADNILNLPLGKQLLIHFTIVNVPVERVAIGKITARLSKGKLSDEELSDSDWEEINKYDFGEPSRKVVNYFRDHGNQLTSFSQLVKAEVARPGVQQRFNIIQVVFNKNGGKYNIRCKERSHPRDWTMDLYKVYKIER